VTIDNSPSTRRSDGLARDQGDLAESRRRAAIRRRAPIPAEVHSKAIDTDEKFSYVFTQPGTYPYFCAVHPKMTAKIV